MDQAAVLRELKANLGSPWEAIAKRLGLSKRRVLDLVGLLDLPEEIKEDIRQKKLTERHGHALRQLLDKAEVLREVFNFIKDKKLTGEQTQELVQTIKSEPRFTMEEAYNKTSFLGKKNKEVTTQKEPFELLVSEGNKFLKILNKLDINNIEIKNKEFIKDNLLSIKRKIQNLLKILKL